MDASDTATILLAKDEPTVREVTRQALEMGGYRVLATSSPEEAKYIASNSCMEIDLLPTVFMTGYAESEVVRAVHSQLLPVRSGPHHRRPVCTSRG